MNVNTAREIGRKAKAYNHCVNLIRDVDKNGEKEIKLNSSGVRLKIKKGDSLYLKFLTVMSQLREEINECEVMRRNNVPIIAPAGSAPTEEALEAKREKKRAYYRAYYQKKKAQKKESVKK